MIDFDPDTIVTWGGRECLYKVLYYCNWPMIDSLDPEHLVVIEPVDEHGVPLRNIVTRIYVPAGEISRVES